MVAFRLSGLALLAASSIARAAPTTQDWQTELQPVVAKFVAKNPFLGFALAKLVDGNGEETDWTVSIVCDAKQVEDYPSLTRAVDASSEHHFFDRVCRAFQVCAGQDLDRANAYHTCTLSADNLGYCQPECSYVTPCSHLTPTDDLRRRLDGAHSLEMLSFVRPSNITNPDYPCSKPDGTLRGEAPGTESTQRGDAVSADLLRDFNFYSQHAAATYCNTQYGNDHKIDCEGSCPLVEAAKVQLVHTFYGDVSDINGYVAIDKKREEIVLAIRGSWSARNWWADARATLDDCPYVRGCGIHTGFYSGWRDIKHGVIDAIQKSLLKHSSFRVVATGHSLGGAIATIAVTELRSMETMSNKTIDAFTYGSPRVGNAKFAIFASSQPGTIYRITQGGDPITRMPAIAWHYAHTSPEYWIDDSRDDAILDPKVTDIVKCIGMANTNCTLGTLGVDIFVHRKYFGVIDGCRSFIPDFKRSQEVQQQPPSELTLGDAEKGWIESDRNYALEAADVRGAANGIRPIPAHAQVKIAL
ncbi:hypothetical protein DCS_05519 [Drechmeria coniospora]|uniref:Fungal lipase-type domain-containing protein n=1 Tax=Drechmeria coniospora TaxID=98403 RepID=A0A151GN20_DRECN|nr:hypothetical protein DCS_05519 [Drechmeria coniospora]KYK58503.1 hypothetical protein DCS_05519 [Drechmeria coniospora]